MSLAEKSINEYLSMGSYACSCGKTHRADIDRIIIKKGALDEMPDALTELIDKTRHEIFMLADGNTYKVVGKTAEKKLAWAGFTVKKLILPGDKQVVPDELTVFKALNAIEKNVRLIMAAGSGTINDICRYLACKLNMPYIVVASAPSMDGFASNVSAMVVNNLKTTYITGTPRIIVGDPDILKEAPHEMIAAGLGDILGKYNALCDWKVSSILTGEHFCDEIAEMVEKATIKCANSAKGLFERDDKSIEQLMEALVLTGIAMSFWGNSRPASSAEHHIAHFWEMTFLFEHKEAVLHGTKVGIASVAAALMQNLLANESNIDYGKAEAAARAFDFDIWAEKVREVFGAGAEEIITHEKETGFYKPENRLKRIRNIRENWPEIVKTIKKYTPDPGRIESLIKTAHGSTNPREVGILADTVISSLIHAKELRAWHTLLQLLCDLNMLEDYARKVNDYFI